MRLLIITFIDLSVCFFYHFILRAGNLLLSFTGPHMEKDLAPGWIILRVHSNLWSSLKHFDDEIWDFWVHDIEVEFCIYSWCCKGLTFWGMLGWVECVFHMEQMTLSGQRVDCYDLNSGPQKDMCVSKSLEPVNITLLGKRVFEGSWDEIILDYPGGS